MTETTHTDRRASSGPDLDYGEAILRQLAGLRREFGNGKATDPTLNVKEALEGAVRRLDDLRDNDRYWQDKLDQEKDRANAQIAKANDKAAVAEKERLDAQRSEDKAAIALALAAGQAEAKTLVAQVDTTAKALAAAGGRDTQRVESTARSQWTTERVIAFAVIALGALYFVLDRVLPR